MCFFFFVFSEGICIMWSLLSPLGWLLDLKRVAYGCFLSSQKKKKKRKKTKALVRVLVKC